MYCLKVKGLAGIDHAALDWSGIALLTGPNGAGKSSLCQAAAICLTGNLMVRGIKKKNRVIEAVREGEDAARILLEHADGATSVSLPEGEISGRGRPMQSSQIAAGVFRFSDLSARDRALWLNDLLSPSNPAISAELVKAGLDAAEAERYQKTIEVHGWDVAWVDAKHAAQKSKAAWELITGENWGSAKASGWVPEGLRMEVSLPDVDQTRDLVARRKAELEKMAGAEYLKAAQAHDLDRLVRSIPIIEEHIEMCKARRAARESSVAELLIADAALPQIEIDRGLGCPHGCAGRRLRLVEKQGVREIVAVIDTLGDDIPEKDRNSIIKKRRSILADIKSHNAGIARETAEINSDQENIRVAKKTVALLSRTGEDVSHEDIEQARQELARLEGVLAALRQRDDATGTQARIEAFVAVAALLAPEGLRRQALTKSLVQFNEDLSALYNDFAGEVMRIDDDMTIRAGGRTFELLSEGEKTSVDIAIQIVAAMTDGSDMVIIDKAEELEPSLRNKLLVVLHRHSLPAMVTRVVSTLGKAPDLAAKGVGMTFWIERGTACATTSHAVP